MKDGMFCISFIYLIFHHIILCLVGKRVLYSYFCFLYHDLNLKFQIIQICKMTG